MKPPCQFPRRSRLLGRAAASSILSLSLWSTGLPLGILYASAQTVPATVRSGYSLVEQGLVNQAIALFEQAVQQFPQSLEARLGLAIAYRRAGRDADAFQAYERALTLDPTNRLALLSLGTLGGYRPEWQKRGIAALTTLLQNHPEDQEARAQRALLYIYEGQFADAIADYELVLQKNPSPEAIVGAAQAYAYNGTYEKSLTLFDRYLQGGGTLQGDRATAYARVLRETGNPTAAVQALEAPLRQQRNLTGPAIRMRAEQALNYAAIGRLDLAKTMLAPLQGRTDARMELGRTLIAIGRTSHNSTYLKDGIDLFKAALPEASPAMQREIANALAGFPESQSVALELYQQLSQQQPDDRGLQTQVIVLQYQTGQLSEADLLTQLAQTLQTLPSDPLQQRSIAQALIQLRTPNSRLLPLYENLVRAGITEPLLYFRIAQIYLRQKDYAKARSVIATYQTTPLGKADAGTELILAAIDQQQGNLDSSIRRYQTIINSAPKDKDILSGALQGLAGIYQSQGQFKDALTLYNRVIALNPDDPTKQLGQTSLEYQAGIVSQSEAEAVLNRWLTTEPLTQTSPELYSLVAALPANPRLELLYRNLLQADPNNIPIHVRLVELLAKQNQTTAMDYVDQLIARDPENVDVYFLQGHIAYKLGNLEQAATAYESILKREPENVDALSALGGIRFRQRRYQAAVALYSQVLAVQPDHTIARSALAGLEAARHRRIPALRQAEEQQAAEQQAAEPLPDLSNLQSSPPAVEFVPQGNVPLPWDRP